MVEAFFALRNAFGDSPTPNSYSFAGLESGQSAAAVLADHHGAGLLTGESVPVIHCRPHFTARSIQLV